MEVGLQSFGFEARRTGDTIVATLTGDLDMGASLGLEPELERATDQTGVREVVIDMRRVEFMDSAGLGLLLATDERLRAAGVGLTVANPSPAVRRILELTGATAILRVAGEGQDRGGGPG